MAPPGREGLMAPPPHRAGTLYQVGPATLVRRRAGMILLAPAERTSVVHAAWALLGNGPLGAEAPSRLAACAALEDPMLLSDMIWIDLAESEPSAPRERDRSAALIRIGARSPQPVALHTLQGRTLVTGDSRQPVVRQVDGALRVAFGALPPEGRGLPLVEGIVRARGFIHTLEEAEHLGADGARSLAASILLDGLRIEDPERNTPANTTGDESRSADAMGSAARPPRTEGTAVAPPRPEAAGAALLLPTPASPSQPSGTPEAPAAGAQGSSEEGPRHRVIPPHVLAAITRAQHRTVSPESPAASLRTAARGD